MLEFSSLGLGSAVEKRRRMGSNGKNIGERNERSGGLRWPPQTTSRLPSLAEFFSRPRRLFSLLNTNEEPGPRLETFPLQQTLDVHASVLIFMLACK